MIEMCFLPQALAQVDVAGRVHLGIHHLDHTLGAATHQSHPTHLSHHMTQGRDSNLEEMTNNHSTLNLAELAGRKGTMQVILQRMEFLMSKDNQNVGEPMLLHNQ